MRSPNHTYQPTDATDQLKKSLLDDALSMDEVFLQKLRTAVTENLHNEQFSVEDLADSVAMSRSHLHRRLVKLTNQSSTQFIKNIRLEFALEFLNKNIGTVSEIAFKVGFGSSTYFIKCFSEKYGFSPGEARKRNISESNSNTVNTDQPEPPAKAGVSPIEMLHPAAAESMILEIFEAMIKHKPSLGKFLMVDEDEGETVDNRLLAYQIFKSYPFPIGVEIRRLFSVNLNSGDQARYLQLQRTINKNLKILIYILLGELINRLQTQKLTIEKDSGEKLSELLSELSAINIYQSLKILVSLNTTESDFFDDDLKNTFDNSFFREVEAWSGMIVTDDSLPETCESLEQILTFLLKKSSFLLKYKMVSVNNIEVMKPKFKDARFQHSIHILNNVDGEFQIHQEVLEQFADSHAVLLMKSIKNSKEYINLSPFIIDTHHLRNSEPKRSMVKDVFLFQQYADGQLQYTGTEVSAANIDLSGLDNHDMLVEEYVETLNLLINE